MFGDALNAIPLWGLFLGTLLLVLLSIEGGFRLGGARHRQSPAEKEAPVGSMVGATLGLLAFLLAFTFGSAASRFDVKRQLLLDEANAIGTTYLRAGLLPAEHRDEVRRLLAEYVDVRLEATRTGVLDEALRRTDELHRLLWAHAESAGASDPRSEVAGLFIQSLNEVIDLHAKRITAGLRNPIPSTIWLTLYVLSALALGAMGYHGGLTGTSRSLATLVVAVAFSVVMWVIADLDRSQEGSLRVSQQALIDLRNSMTP
jgi:hypothetical protein